MNTAVVNGGNSYICWTVNLTTLTPDIQVAILDNTWRDTVSLFDMVVDTPLSWDDQRQQAIQLQLNACRRI